MGLSSALTGSDAILDWVSSGVMTRPEFLSFSSVLLFSVVLLSIYKTASWSVGDRGSLCLGRESSLPFCYLEVSSTFWVGFLGIIESVIIGD